MSKIFGYFSQKLYYIRQLSIACRVFKSVQNALKEKDSIIFADAFDNEYITTCFQLNDKIRYVFQKDHKFYVCDTPRQFLEVHARMLKEIHPQVSVKFNLLNH